MPNDTALEDSPLEEFQDALIELLASGEPHTVVLQKLKADPRFEQYRDYINGFDADMVDVACELMGKWARRKQTDSHHR